eukprot:gene18224-25636_t
MSENQLVAQFRAKLSPEINEFYSDADCKRFIQARVKQGIDAAVTMIQNCYTWRFTELAGSIKGVTPNNILLTTRDNNITKYPTRDLVLHSLQGEDIDGNPIYWEKSGLISKNFGEAKKFHSVDDLILMHLRTMEMMELRLKYQSEKYGKQIDKIVTVHDCTGLVFSLDFDIIKYLRVMLYIDQNYFPERMKIDIVINAPWFFPGIFALISPFMDEVTKKKFKIVTAENSLATLLENISPDNIPVEYGGTNSDYTWSGPSHSSSGCSDEQIDEHLRSSLEWYEKYGKVSGSAESVNATMDNNLKLLLDDNLSPTADENNQIRLDDITEKVAQTSITE